MLHELLKIIIGCYSLMERKEKMLKCTHPYVVSNLYVFVCHAAQQKKIEEVCQAPEKTINIQKNVFMTVCVLN